VLAGEVLALVGGHTNEHRILEQLVEVALVDQFAGAMLLLDGRPGLGGQACKLTIKGTVGS